jgi:hypothetical protein
VISALLDICAAQAEAQQPAACFGALDRALQQCVGHQLMTILRIDETETWSERMYSSRPDIFSPQGRKSLAAAPQMRRVIAGGRPLIVDGEAAIRAAFPDHALIFSLGCRCVLNVPVRWRGRSVANLNLLGAAAYSDSDAALAQLAAQLCLPALLMNPTSSSSPC